MQSLLHDIKPIKGLAPAADRWNTNPSTDVVSLRNHEQVAFLVHQQGGTTGTATLTVEACDNVTPSNTTAIPFAYRVGAAGAGAGGDVFGPVVQATASGFTTTAADDRLYLIVVEGSDLTADKPFVRLKCTEAVNDPINGAVEIILGNPRYGGPNEPTDIA